VFAVPLAARPRYDPAQTINFEQEPLIMKIDPNHPQPQIERSAGESHGARKGVQDGPLSFQEILARVGPQASSQTPSVTGPETTAPPLGIGLPFAPPLSEEPQLNQTEELLGAFDEIASLIEQPEVSPHLIQRQLDALVQKSEVLLRDLEQFPADHPLRKLGEELAMLCEVERAKWRRGDYL